MRVFVIGLVALLPFVLSGCGADNVFAPEEQVRAAVYRDAQSPPSITLFTMINNRSGEGAHSGLLINGSQRVIFDPAGSWWHSRAPERHDVHFGITPTMLDFYIDYHARETFRVEMQTIEVSPEVAELALTRVQQNGAVPKAFCANATSKILQGLPGFESIPVRMYPGKVKTAFAKLPGVTTKVVYDDDADDNKLVLAAQQAGR